MVRRLGFVLLLASSLGLTGCGTCLRGQMAGVYRGTKFDGMMLSTGLSPASIVGDAHAGLAAETAIRTAYVVAGLVDLPLSLATDTVCLPYDIVQAKKTQRTLAQILEEHVPAGAEILEMPKGIPEPCRVHLPLVGLVGKELASAITGRDGKRKEYQYAAEPGTYVKIIPVQDRRANLHFLAVRVRVEGPDGTDDAGKAELRATLNAKLALLRQEEQRLARDLKPGHPRMKQLRQEIGRIEDSIRALGVEHAE